MTSDKRWIKVLLDEVNQDPEREFEIDRYIFPLFNKMLNTHGFQFNVLEIREDSVRCKIQRISSET